jgi:hypothetical protein
MWRVRKRHRASQGASSEQNGHSSAFAFRDVEHGSPPSLLKDQPALPPDPGGGSKKTRCLLTCGKPIPCIGYSAERD